MQAPRVAIEHHSDILLGRYLRRAQSITRYTLGNKYLFSRAHLSVGQLGYGYFGCASRDFADPVASSLGLSRLPGAVGRAVNPHWRLSRVAAWLSLNKLGLVSDVKGIL